MMIILHKVRGHKVEPFRVTDPKRPWRWQCSCGKVFGGDAPFRHVASDPFIKAKIEVVKDVEELSTDIIETVRERTPDEDDIERLEEKIEEEKIEEEGHNGPG